MADYDWFDRDYSKQQDSDEKVYGETANFDVTDVDTSRIHAKAFVKAKNSDIQATAKKVWCNFCQCSIQPYVWAMRQHRKGCSADPRVAGNDDAIGVDNENQS